MRILVVNRGSSSLKLSVLDDGDAVVASVNETLGAGEDPGPRLEAFLGDAPPVDVAGIRVVHGGPWYHDSVLIDDAVSGWLGQLAELAPLHNPPSLAVIAALRRLRPDLPAIACFDTAFHASLPPAAFTYAVPPDWEMRRYGFHGLSHAYASRRAASLLGRPVAELRLVTCHLGAGASLCAVLGGVSVDTTMGYTPLEGVVMATRSGSIDPGAVLAVQRRLDLSASDVEDVLNHRSGLLALAGTADMRSVLAAAADGSDPARLALAVYLHRLRAAIAAMAAAMGGIDGLVFTGGIGEGAPEIRAGAAEGLGWMGVALDPSLNGSGSGSGSGDREISAPGAAVRTLVVEAREDIEVARSCRRLLSLQNMGK